MTETEFLPRDTEKAFESLKQELYQRLEDVRRSLNVRFDQDDLFNQGIDCAKCNEELWLSELLDKIERS